MNTLNRLPTTTVTRVPCNMWPDPCPGKDYRITGVSNYGDEFSVRVHHRCRGCWKLEQGDFRQCWREFLSLQDVVNHLEQLY